MGTASDRAAGSPLGLVFFDIDGTLVPGTSSGQYLARHLGHLDALADAEARYAAGTATNQEVSVLDAAGWRGRTVADVEGWLSGLPLLRGVAETVAWCRDHRLEPYLATLAWEPVGRHLAGVFGFAGHCGPRLVAADGRYTGDVELHVDEHDKLAFAVATAERVGVPLSACAAVGDSRSDLPLFDQVGLAVAVNASPAAADAATHAVEGDDLTMILPYLQAWLAGLQPQR